MSYITTIMTPTTVMMPTDVPHRFTVGDVVINMAEEPAFRKPEEIIAVVKHDDHLMYEFRLHKSLYWRAVGHVDHRYELVSPVPAEAPEYALQLDEQAYAEFIALINKRLSKANQDALKAFLWEH